MAATLHLQLCCSRRPRLRTTCSFFTSIRRRRLAVLRDCSSIGNFFQMKHLLRTTLELFLLAVQSTAAPSGLIRLGTQRAVVGGGLRQWRRQIVPLVTTAFVLRAPLGHHFQSGDLGRASPTGLFEELFDGPSGAQTRSAAKYWFERRVHLRRLATLCLCSCTISILRATLHLPPPGVTSTPAAWLSAPARRLRLCTTLEPAAARHALPSPGGRTLLYRS